MHGRFQRSLSQPSAPPPAIKVYDYKINELVQLQDTIGRYRGEMAGIKVKSRLENLMGSDVVQLNDRSYMLKLQEQLSREYEVQMDRRESLREDRERRRQRRLYIDGLQDKPNMDAKASRPGGLSSAPYGGSRVSKDASPDAHSPLSSGHRFMAQVRCSTAPSGNRDFLEDRPSPQHHLLTASGTPNPCGLSLPMRCGSSKRSAEKPKTADAPEDRGKNPSKVKPDGATASACPRETSADADALNSGQSDMDLAQTKSPRASLLRQLRHEQTVRGLYTAADALIKRLPQPANPNAVKSSD